MHFVTWKPHLPKYRGACKQLIEVQRSLQAAHCEHSLERTLILHDDSAATDKQKSFQQSARSLAGTGSPFSACKQTTTIALLLYEAWLCHRLLYKTDPDDTAWQFCIITYLLTMFAQRKNVQSASDARMLTVVQTSVSNSVLRLPKGGRIEVRHRITWCKTMQAFKEAMDQADIELLPPFSQHDDDAFYLFLQKKKLALEPYTLPPGTPKVSLAQL